MDVPPLPLLPPAVAAAAPLNPDPLKFVQSLMHTGLPNEQTIELMITQGVKKVDEFGLISAVDVIEIRKAVIKNGGLRILVTNWRS